MDSKRSEVRNKGLAGGYYVIFAFFEKDKSSRVPGSPVSADGFRKRPKTVVRCFTSFCPKNDV